MKRLLSIILVLCMVASMLPISAYAEEYPVDTNGTVSLGVTEMQITEDYSYYSFTPEKDGTYRFFTEGDCDTYGILNDCNGEFICSNDDGGYNCNFFIEEALYAGETYIIGVRSYSGSGSTELNIEEYIIPTSGSCGDNLTWKLENGTLTISGTEEMYYYDYYDVPWNDSRNSIYNIVIENGVTSIGYDAFCYCSSLESMTIPSSVTSISSYAFRNCSSLKFVAFTGNEPLQVSSNIFENVASDFTIFAPDNNLTWTNSEYYNSDSQTWNEYR